MSDSTIHDEASGLVCYVTIDSPYYAVPRAIKYNILTDYGFDTPDQNSALRPIWDLFNTEKMIDGHTYNITPDCVITYGKRIGGDYFTAKAESGIVVALNTDNNLVYQTKIEEIDHLHSECNGPDAHRSWFNYYVMTEEQLTTCGVTSIDDSL